MSLLGIKTPQQTSNMLTERAADNTKLSFDIMEDNSVVAKTMLATKILKSWESAKSNKTIVEHSMLDCLRDRKGEYAPDEMALIAEAGGSDIFIRTATAKVRAGIAHIKSILMPAAEKAYGIDPTDRPKLPKYMEEAIVARINSNPNFTDQNGQPMDPVDQARMLEEKTKDLIRQQARAAARNHETLIFDQLQEGGWHQALSDFIDDICTYPVAFMKGPFVMNKPTLRWERGPFGMEMVSGMEQTRCFRSVNPFDAYWAPGADNIQMHDFIERLRLNVEDVYNLIGVPGYNEEAIRNVLQMHGRNGLRNWLWTDSARSQIADHLYFWQKSTTEIDGLHWYGKAQGIELLESGIHPDDIGDPLASYDIDAILIGGEVIRAVINPDPLYRRPIHCTSYEKVPGNVSGNSPSMLMRSSGRMINATSRALQNNLAHASGFQAEVDYTRLASETDPFDIHPFKIWQARESEHSGDRPAVRFFQPTSNAQELMAVIDKFKMQADEDTGIPRLFQGTESQGQGADATARGRAMLADNSTKLLRSAIMNIDVDIIIPKLQMMYDNNMMFHDDDTVKGDCQVVARGANAMLMRDSSRASHMAMLELTNNPEDRQIMGVEGRGRLLKAVLDSYPDIDDGVIPTDEDLEKKAMAIENAPPPPDPAMAKVEAQAQMDQAKLQFEQQKSDREAQDRIADREATKSIEMMKLRAAQQAQQAQALQGNNAEVVKMDKQYELDKRKQDIARETELEKIHVQAQLKREEIAANIQATIRTVAMQQQSADKQAAAAASNEKTEPQFDPAEIQKGIIDAVMQNMDTFKNDMTGAINDIQKMVEKNASLNEAGNFVFNFDSSSDEPVTKVFSTKRDDKGNLTGTVTEEKGKK